MVMQTVLLVTMKSFLFVKVSHKSLISASEFFIIILSATDKCRLPYYGGCPFTRECLSSALDVGCPSCLFGFVEDPVNPGGECLRELS